MPEIRTDPFTGREVIIAPVRLDRPNAIWLTPWHYDDADNCPFCVGRENATPNELARYRTVSESHPWSMRVVPNRYPALTPTANHKHENQPTVAPAGGRQEVLIESPLHLTSFTQLDPAAASLAVQAYRDRLATCHSDRQTVCGLVFKNYGPRAGASLGHIHSQFVAFRETPPILQAEYASFRLHDRDRGTCLLCEILREELDHEARVITSDASFVAFCPWASRVPYEICVAAGQHQGRFEQLSDDDCQRLAVLLTDLLGRLERLIPHVAYNFVIHTAAFDGRGGDQYHWHIEVTPRLTRQAGFEWGSGQWINPVIPAQAAEQLRLIEVDRVC